MRDFNYVWNPIAGSDSTAQYDSTRQYDGTAEGHVSWEDWLGPATFQEVPSYPISDLYKSYLQDRNRDWLIKANIGGTDYGSNVIVDFVVDNSIVSGDDFTLGSAILSKLTLTIKTSDVIVPNAKVIPYLALTGSSGPSEWLPLGEFFIDNREQVNSLWVFTCYDKLVWANVPYVSQLSYPTTQQAVWDEICTRLGYTYDSSVQINPAYQIQAGPAGYSMRQVMGYIASANGACVYIDKSGMLRFRRFGASDQTVIALTTSDYIRAKQLNPVKTFTRVEVTYNTEDDLIYVAGTGDDNHTLRVENPFATQVITNDLYTRLNGFSYTPVQMDARGYPQIEVGDRIRYGEFVDTPTWQDADTAWNATDYSWDGYASGGETLALHTVYTFRGGLKMGVEAPSKSEQQSEFKVDGSLSGQINKLNRDTVKFGKPYYGISHSRTEGIVVEREDHASKLILNSDKMAFQASGVDKIYFDPVAGKYKFNGTLEASDGVFSGSLSAATGTFAGSLSAATGTFSGSLSAATGTFAGNLTAAGGTFAGSLSAATGTFSGNLQAAGGTFAGQLSAASGTFTGTVSAGTISGGTITGASISAGSISGASISGGMITGTTIRTAASGARIELADNKLSTYNSVGFLEGPAFEVGQIIGPNPGTFGTLNFYYNGAARMSINSTSESSIGTNNRLTIYSPIRIDLYGPTLRIGDNNSETSFTTNGSLVGNWYSSNINNNNAGNFTIGNNTYTATVYGTWRWQSGSVAVFDSGSEWRINFSTSTSASNGSITPPTQVVGYIPVTINGTVRKIPYYA